MTDEELFRVEQYCDGQDIFETPEPYHAPTRAEQWAAELAADARDREASLAAGRQREADRVGRRAACPARVALLDSAGSLRALAVAQTLHDSTCLPCREDLARALLAAGAFGEVA